MSVTRRSSSGATASLKVLGGGSGRLNRSREKDCTGSPPSYGKWEVSRKYAMVPSAHTSPAHEYPVPRRSTSGGM
nr:hypothetical protein [Streptomyces sp. alain-838]